jgi:tripartite-type tricarboxylate transporter receptor subunit TctC
MTSFRAVLAVLAAGLPPALCGAQAFPTKPVRVVVPFPPGGVDVTIRLMQNGMQADLGQPIVIENRPGANGFIGSEYVAHQPADGYTLLATSSSTLIAGPAVSSNVPFDAEKDFAPITMIFSTVSTLVAKPSLPVSSVRELIDLAKASPGKLSYASTGIGSAQHLDAETFKLTAGVDLNHIPYKGFGPVVQALLGQEVDVAFVTTQTVAPLIAAGKVKLLALYNGKRPANFPDLPQLSDFAPGFRAVPGFIGLLGPATLARPIVMRLNGAAVKTLRSPDVTRKLEEVGANIVADTPDEFAQAIKSGLENAFRAANAARARGVKFE